MVSWTWQCEHPIMLQLAVYMPIGCEHAVIRSVQAIEIGVMWTWCMLKCVSIESGWRIDMLLLQRWQQWIHSSCMLWWPCFRKSLAACSLFGREDFHSNCQTFSCEVNIQHYLLEWIPNSYNVVKKKYRWVCFMVHSHICRSNYLPDFLAQHFV